MHYKNGREAKNGDKVVRFVPVRWNEDGTKVLEYAVETGILYDAVAGNDYCNGKIARTSVGDLSPNLKECLRADDVQLAVDQYLLPPKS